MSGILQSFIGSMAGVTPIPYGGHLFEGNTNGTRVQATWTAPENVTEVSVVCIGGGGNGGGALSWINGYTVIPGNDYAVQVGSGDGAAGTGAASSDLSFFVDTSTCQAGGGSANTTSSGSGSAVRTGDGGGNGGGGYAPYDGYGGAGGYSGNGGNGAILEGSYPPAAEGTVVQYSDGGDGSGGGGGGGGGRRFAAYWNTEDPTPFWDYTSAMGRESPFTGGGVGVYGEGSSGAGGDKATPSVTAKSGTPGSGGVGNKYGAGKYGPGAVRIIWGPGDRAFPSTNVSKDYGNVSETITSP